MSEGWWDTPRAKTDVGWNMPYFTTAKYGFETREPIAKMLTDIVDNTSDNPNLIADIHKIASEIMYPAEQTAGKDSRYLSVMKDFLCKSFWWLDLDRSQTEYVGPGAEPYNWDVSCEDEIIAIWNSIDPTVMRDNIYKAFMKLAYGGWINYDKVINGTAVPKDILSTNIKRVTVHGTENGCGSLDVGKNYLEPRLEAIPNGAAGTWLSYAPAFVNAVNGITVNSGNATRLLFQIRHTNDSAIQPSHVGDIMMVEGSIIPTAYDADTTMYKKRIMQGNIVNHNATAARVAGETQELYCGDDGGGGTNNYIISSSNIAIRCKTYSIPVKQNTDYSIRVFNSSYNDIEFYTCYYSEPGTITPTFTSCSAYTQKAIPSNGPFITSEEQWVKLNYSHERNISDYWGPVGTVPCDVRPLTYEYCNYYATLKAGTYKVMIDTWGNNRFWGTGGYWTGIDNYTGCVYDNFNYDQLNSIYEWFSLIEEDNTVIIPKTKLLPDDIGSKMVKIEGATPPLPNYFHKEVEFTIDHDCKVGLIHKAYYYSPSEVYPPYFRFMIVDSDVEAEYFETTGADPAQMQGYSAWEKYRQVITVTVNFSNKFTGESESVTTEVQGMLYSNDSFYIDTTLDCETGIVTIDTLERDSVDPTITPTVDVSYS